MRLHQPERPPILISRQLVGVVGVTAEMVKPVATHVTLNPVTVIDEHAELTEELALPERNLETHRRILPHSTSERGEGPHPEG